MSHITEFMTQVEMTPMLRKGNITSAWDCFSTASKMARVYRSVAKSGNRLVSFAADIIASHEEYEHPESKEFITKTFWTVYKVSPLWNVRFKKTKTKKGLEDSEYYMAERQEYDEAALRRYATLIRGFLLKNCADFLDEPCTVEITPLLGLRGSRNDRDALLIKVNSVLDTSSKTVFTGVLCGVETAELQIKTADGISIPVFLTSGPQDITDRVIHGLIKCFDCVISPLVLSAYEMLWMSALWTGLEDTQDGNHSSVDCTIQRRPLKRKSLEETTNLHSSSKTSSPPNCAEKESTRPRTTLGRKTTMNAKIVFVYSIPPEIAATREKISALTLTLGAEEVKKIWRHIHKAGEMEVTEAEMSTFHAGLNQHIEKCLSLRVQGLQLDEVKLPYVAVSRRGRFQIQHPDHVKLILRHLTQMCQGEMLSANPTLGISEESIHGQWS